MTGNLHSQIDRFQTIQRLPLFFQNNSKDFFSFLKFKDFSRLVLNSRLVHEPCKDEGGGGDNWSFKTCKTPVKSSSSTTNQTPSFIQAWCPSCHPTNSVIVSANLSLLTYLLTYLLWQHWREEVSHSTELLTRAHTSLTNKGSWLPWKSVAKPFTINLTPVSHGFFTGFWGQLVPSVLWHCWLGVSKGIWVMKTIQQGRETSGGHDKSCADYGKAIHLYKRRENASHTIL